MVDEGFAIYEVIDCHKNVESRWRREGHRQATEAKL